MPDRNGRKSSSSRGSPRGTGASVLRLPTIRHVRLQDQGIAYGPGHARIGHMPTTASTFTYSADVVLRDGSTVHLRPIRPDDDGRLLDLLHRMSEDALYYRFLSVPKIDREKAQQMA